MHEKGGKGQIKVDKGWCHLWMTPKFKTKKISFCKRNLTKSHLFHWNLFNVTSFLNEPCICPSSILTLELKDLDNLWSRPDLVWETSGPDLSSSATVKAVATSTPPPTPTGSPPSPRRTSLQGLQFLNYKYLAHVNFSRP